MARFQGLLLGKSRRRDPRATDNGLCALFDAHTGNPDMYNLNRICGFTLDEIEAALRDE